MLDSPMIDVALGLILFFLVMSLSVMAAQEWVSSVLKLKGKNLREGIENLVGNEISEKIYNHSLMKTMGTKSLIHKIKSRIFKWKGKKVSDETPRPSYLNSNYFAKILIDVIDTNRDVFKEEKTEIQELTKKISNPQIQKVFQLLNIKAGEGIEAIEGKISGWFDAGMDRVAGLYKRKAQLCSFIISFVLVIGLNANAIIIAQELWDNDDLRAQTTAIIDQIEKDNSPSLNKSELLNEINKAKIDFPLGWKNEKFTWSFYWLFQAIIGWFITIAAISLGAPFWFDLLRKVSNIRKSLKAEGSVPNSQKASSTS